MLKRYIKSLFRFSFLFLPVNNYLCVIVTLNACGKSIYVIILCIIFKIILYNIVHFYSHVNCTTCVCVTAH